MIKRRQRKAHVTTPLHLCHADRPAMQNSSFGKEVDKGTPEYLALQCADAPKTSPPSNAQDCGPPNPSFSDSQKWEKMSAEKRKKNKKTKTKSLDYKLKLLTNHQVTDPHFTYSQYVTNELRKYDSQTLAYVKKVFSKVLFNADTGTLQNRHNPRNLQSCASVSSDENLHYRLKILPNYLTTDPYFAFSQYLASELRKYDHQTLACVKKEFSKVLFKADAGTLLNSYHSRNLKNSPASVKSTKHEQNARYFEILPTIYSSLPENKKENWKDVVPVDVETSVNPFQSTDEEVNSSWEDILSDSMPSSSEADSSTEAEDLSTEVAEYSSPEIMRFEGNISEEIISPLEIPRKTIDLTDSDLNFNPKLASTLVESRLENSRIFDSPVHESTKIGIPYANNGLTFNAPDITGFAGESEETVPLANNGLTFNARDITGFAGENEETDSSGTENSLPSTIEAPGIVNFEQRISEGKGTLSVETTSTGFDNILNFLKKEKNAETSFITTVNTEDIVDTVFKHPGEPSSLNLDGALIADETSENLDMNEKSINKTPVNASQTKRMQRRKMNPKKLFIHSKLSSEELSFRNSCQSSTKKKGKRNRKSIIPSLPKASSTFTETSREDPYHFTSEEADLDAGVYMPMNMSLSVEGKTRKKKQGKRKRRKEKTGGTPTRGKKESSSSQPSVKWSPLSKKEAEEYREYLKTVPKCPLRLQNSCCARMNEEASCEEI